MKKIISIALSVLLIFALLLPAAAAGEKCTISPGDCDAVPGGTAQMQIRIGNNPGICGLSAAMNLPDGFTVKETVNGDLLDTLTSGVNMVWDNAEPADGDGLLATVILNVDASVEPGEYYAGLTINEACSESAHISPDDMEAGIGCITVKDTIIRDLKETSSGIRFKVETSGSGSFYAVAACYDTNGRMLSCTAKAVSRAMCASGVFLPVTEENRTNAVLFLMDGSTFEPVTERVML